MPSHTVREITKGIAEKAEQESTPYLISENATQGFALRVGARKKAWVISRKFMGMTRKLTIGSYPALMPDDARRKARQALAQMENGIDPKEEFQKRKRDHETKRAIEHWTLDQLWQAYLDDPRDQPLSANTLKGYERGKKRLENSALWTIPLATMTPDDVRAGFDHLLITTNSRRASNGGKTQAAVIMRYARAVLRFGLASKLEGKFPDPFDLLEKKKKWKQPEPKNRTVIDGEGDLARWWSAVEALRTKTDPRAVDSPAIADYLALSLLWGGRKTEMLTLKWLSVDFSLGGVAFEADQTKNKKRHLIPLAPYARSILERRWQERDELPVDERSDYVFPASRTGYKTGIRAHISEPKGSIAEVRTASGVPFSPHDLRRTFGTLLGEIGASFYQTKAAMNHADGGDITQRHYMRIRLKALKEVFTRLEAAILEEAGIKQSVQVQAEDITPEELKAFRAWKVAQQQA